MHIKALLSILKISFISLLFLIVCSGLYFSFLGPKNLSVIDTLIKTLVEKNIPQVQIESLETGVLLDWKDRSIVLSIADFKVTYGKKTSFTLPAFKLKLDPVNLILKAPEQALKGLSFDNQKMDITYHQAPKLENLEQEKIPISYLTDSLEKYRLYLNHKTYAVDDFVLNIQNNGAQDMDVVLKNTVMQLDFEENMGAQIKTTIEINGLTLQADFTIKNNLANYLDVTGSFLTLPKDQDNSQFHVFNTDIKTSFQVSLDTKLHFLNFFEQINFEFLQRGASYIANDAYISDPMKINSLEFKGRFMDNFKETNISSIKASVEDNILIDGSCKYESENFTSNFNIAGLSTEQVLNKWHNALYPEVHSWLSKHLLAGIVNNIQITKVNNAQETLPLTTTILLKDINLKYLATAPNLYLNDARLEFSSEKLTVYSTNAKIASTQIKEITATIDNFAKDQIAMKFNTLIHGSIEDQINIANAHYKIASFPHIKGVADTRVTLVVPFYKVPTFEEINLDFQSRLHGVNIENIFHGYTLNQGDFEANLLDQKLKIKGRGKINGHINTRIDSTFSIENKGDFVTLLDINDIAENFQKANIPFTQFFGDQIKVRGTIKATQHMIDSEFIADLYNTSVNLSAIGVDKKPQKPGKLLIKLNSHSADETKISKFSFVIPEQTFSGIGIINNKASELTYFKGNISQQHDRGFTLTYSKLDNIRKITLDGKEANLSDFDVQELLKLLNSDEKQKKSLFSFLSKISTLKLKNGVVLSETNLSANNLRNKNFHMSGLLDNDKTFKVYYNYPVLSITSSDAGAVLRGLGITEKVNAGTLEIKGQFQNPQKFQGYLELNNFYALKTPSLINLLTLSAPIATLQHMIKNKGIEFYSLICPIEYTDDLLEFKDCVASSKLIALKISGNIDLESGYLNSKGIIVPENIVNTLFKRIPFLNILSGRKNEGLILSTLFDMKGYINKEIKIQANYLSTFTPGFLREIFKKPLNTSNKDMMKNKK